MLKKIFLIVIVNSILSLNVFSQEVNQQAEENIIAQMNYCILTLTDIIHNKSMSVLEHESDQLVNNLTLEQIIGLYDIRDFRIELLDAISKFEITEEERRLTKRLQSMKRDNQKWAALSNALNPTMLLTGSAGPGMQAQLAFQTLLTVARTTVEYKMMSGDGNIEELQAMWNLRKEDMKTINEVRKTAQSILFNLYTKYHLSENDRLTESTANQFNEYITENNAAKRVRLLEDNRDKYKKVAAYYYYLGMAYVDAGDYEKAKTNFSIYKELYSRAPILRCDEKSGCIALTMLSIERNLSEVQKRELINIALTNLPSNSAAILQCAMVYLYELNEEERGLNLIRAGIEDPQASDKNILYMAAANLQHIMSKYPTIQSEVRDAFNHAENIDFESYVTYLFNSQQNAWESLASFISFKDFTYWKWWWPKRRFNDNLHIIIPESLMYNIDDVFVYIEKHEKKKLVIKQMNVKYGNGITIKKVNKVDCFKENENLKYLFLDVLSSNEVYKVKKNLDYNRIRKEEYPRMSEFTLTDSDIDDIIDFCKDYTPKDWNTDLKLKEIKSKEKKDSINNVVVKFQGDTLLYKPFHSIKQKGYFIRLVFKNGINLLYYYNDKGKEIVPYLYSKGDNIVFANDDYRKEYEYKEQTTEEEKISKDLNNTDSQKLSWWNKGLYKIKMFFINLWNKIF